LELFLPHILISAEDNGDNWEIVMSCEGVTTPIVTAQPYLGTDGVVHMVVERVSRQLDKLLIKHG
jgi:hypothetical protein